LRYVSRQPRDDVNVSKEHPLVEASTLIVGLGLIFLAIAVVLILLVDLVLLFVSPDKEVGLFESWSLSDYIATDADDSRLESLQGLTDRLAGHWPESPYTYRVQIADSDELNAVALPGGTIVVTSGLLDAVESENELAFVLGHEIGHFRNRDHIRGLGRGVVLSIFLAALSGSDSGVNLGSSLSDLTLRGFSRGQEEDADEFGLSIVNSEYGHVANSWRFFERLADKELGVATYLSTHPSPGDRVTRLIQQAGGNGWAVDGAVVDIDW
jgi:Zn-dependent protease with chaperone function